MQTLEHRQQLDGLRFFCFLAVFMIHSDVENFWWGSYGVSLFFVISGFLITRILIASQDRPRAQVLKAFYVRRALRIFPAYYLVLGVAAATVGIAYLWTYVLYVMNWGIFFYTWIEPALVDRPWTRADVRHPLLVAVRRGAVLSGLPAAVHLPAAGTHAARLAARTVGCQHRPSGFSSPCSCRSRRMA